MVTIWSVLIVVFAAVELATVGLASIWFALGALAALLVTLLHVPVAAQIAVFLVVSVAALIVTRPLAKKYLNSRTQRTNADRVLGTSALCTETINNTLGTGAVQVDGKIWSARSTNGKIIEAGATVAVVEIAGVKLIVEENPI